MRLIYCFLLCYFPFTLQAETVEEKLQTHIKFSQTEQNRIGRIIIDDRSNGINESTWLYVKKALDYYKTKKPIFIILELNTPGGEVFAAQKISDALKDMDTQYEIPCVAYINNWAISAGAMLAYSCRFIVVVKDSAMGAAEPMLSGQTGEMKEASEKVNSAFRSDFANRAAFFDRNPFIAEAMVDKDTILVLRHGKVIKLSNENQIVTTGSDPDEIVSPKGKLLTLTSDLLMKYGVADLLVLPQKIPAITEQEYEKGEWPAEKMLSMQAPFFKSIPNAVIDQYEMDWKTKFFVLLANPVVSSLLFMGMLLGFYTEFSAGTFGLAGTLGLTCLFLIALSSFALEIGNVLELILLVAGMAAILVELFVLPTFGLLGFIGIIFFFVGLFGLMLPGAGSIGYEIDTNQLNAAGHAFFERLSWLSGALALTVIIIVLLARYVLPSFSGFNRFVLKGNEQVSYSAVDDKTLPAIKSKGEVLATLRPAGKVMIDGAVYDAITAGHFLEKGESITVIGYESGSLLVNNIKEDGE